MRSDLPGVRLTLAFALVSFISLTSTPPWTIKRRASLLLGTNPVFATRSTSPMDGSARVLHVGLCQHHLGIRLFGKLTLSETSAETLLALRSPQLAP